MKAMMSRLRGLSLIAMLALSTAGLIAPAGAQAPPGAPTASAQIVNSQGQAVGSAQLVQIGTFVQVTVTVQGLPPGLHGIHIHAVGRCDPPAFTSAGGHFNPTNRQHGFFNPQGPHAGDLPVISIGQDGRAQYQTQSALFTLTPGPTSLFDADGAAIVIHADPDDQLTDPTGNSGARIACGVLAAAQAVTPTPTPQPDLAAIYRQFIEAINRGDVAAAVAAFADDAALIVRPLCPPDRPCVGKAFMQERIELAVSTHTRFDIVDLRVSGTSLTARVEERSDIVRAARVERIIFIDTMAFRGDKISRRELASDRTDPQTAAFIAARQPAPAQPAPAPARTGSGGSDGRGSDLRLLILGAVALLGGVTLVVAPRRR